MRVKTADLTGAALDLVVAKIEGHEIVHAIKGLVLIRPTTGFVRDIIGWSPTLSWAQGGPIKEREGICTTKFKADPLHPEPYWIASPWEGARTDQSVWTRGPTELVAAMRCFVASRLGDEVDVPDELLEAK